MKSFHMHFAVDKFGRRYAPLPDVAEPAAC